MTTDDFAARLQARIATLPRTTRRVAQYFAQHPLEVISRSASELGATMGTSDATIVRAAQALGYAGLSDLKRALTASLTSATPSDRFSQTIGVGRTDARRVLERALASQAKIVAELSEEQGRAALEAIALGLASAPRIVLFGLGPTAHIAAYGAQMLRRHGREAIVLHTPGTGMADDLLTLRDGDAMLVFAYGAPYPEVSAAMAEALALNSVVALVTDSARSQLAQYADLIAIVPRGESSGMAMHGATMVWLEALLAMMAALDIARTRAGLQKLERLRKGIAMLGG